MKIYLASLLESIVPEFCEQAYTLLSFYYANNKTKAYIPKCKDLMIDSGAFTFMGKHKDGSGNFDEFIDDYIRFINEFKIDKFMELDVDMVKGLPYVERVRNKIERETGRKCIPVWHVTRGMQYYKDLCKEYDYIAIGGIGSDPAINEILPVDFPKLKPLVDYAHCHGTKVHGLGFTSMKYLPYIHFDSVDSSTWTSGGRFGQLHFFDSKSGRINLENLKKENKRLSYRKASVHNVQEWIKFINYADRNY